MTTRRTISFSVLLLGMSGLAMALSGCGGARVNNSLSTGDAKVEPTKNEMGEVIGTAQDGFKNMDTSGTQKQ